MLQRPSWRLQHFTPPSYLTRMVFKDAHLLMGVWSPAPVSNTLHLDRYEVGYL